MSENISGYTYGRAEVGRSPVSLTDLQALMQSVGWNKEDARRLKAAGKVFSPQAETMVDRWRAIIGEQPHLLRWFLKPDGKPDEEYKAAVKKRFVQWVRDTCEREYDQAWLDYQHEIGLRHTPAKKNATDGGHTPPLVPLRYLITFAEIVAQSGRDFLIEAGIDRDEIEALHAAWRKSIVLQMACAVEPSVCRGRFVVRTAALQTSF
jgi:hypothetical protein